MKLWQTIALCVLLSFGAAGIVYLLSTQPSGEPIQLIPPPTPAPIQVQVVGAVTHPGVVTIPTGSRVQDAIAAAGGFTEGAEPFAINPARLIQDGERIFVPAKGEYQLTAIPGDADSVDPNTASLVNINTASLQELEELPSIGPSKAQAILAYRQSQGAFSSIDQLLEVPGIGPSLFESIKGLVTIGSEP